MKIVVLAGGVSTERDVSLVSGSKIYKALKENGHQVVLLDIFLGYEGDIQGIFEDDRDWAASIDNISESAPDINAVKASRKDKSNALFGPNVIDICRSADIVFMGLHGDCGENGKVQATFDLFDIKYTGTGYLSSALAMDKALTKDIFAKNGIPTPPGRLLTDPSDTYVPEFPAFVKVCNGGSSVGVFKVTNEDEYWNALKEAFSMEDKVLVETAIIGREFSDGVIDGESLPVVELAPKTGFYDYKNKYQADSTVETCPALISPELEKTIRDYAVKAYNALGIETYARMDFMVDKDENVYCLEANTLPGMTPMSLIPQEAAVIGYSFGQLCERIIEISLDK